MESAAVAAAHRLAGELLAPSAAAVDRQSVPATHLDALSAAGLHGIVATEPAAVRREVAEVLAGACASTWFVWTQHNTPVEMVVASDNRSLGERLLADLTSGRRRAGIAFSHLRRDPPSVTASRIDRGWRIDGFVPWLTGWGLIDLIDLGAATADGEVLFAIVPAMAGARLTVSPPLELAAMRATRTVTAHVTGVEVSDEDIVLRVPLTAWRDQDAARAANVVPGVFGVAEAALAALEMLQRGVQAGPALRLQLTTCRDRAYELIDAAPAGERLDERRALRAEALELGLRIASAHLATVGGRGMALDHPAQRWAREMLFLIIQAQTDASRDATVARLSRVQP